MASTTGTFWPSVRNWAGGLGSLRWRFFCGCPRRMGRRIPDAVVAATSKLVFKENGGGGRSMAGAPVRC